MKKEAFESFAEDLLSREEVQLAIKEHSSDLVDAAKEELAAAVSIDFEASSFRANTMEATGLKWAALWAHIQALTIMEW